MSIPAAREQAKHWHEVRAMVLARDSHTCRDCGHACARGEADVHHLIPRAADGVDDPANLITLCDGCHAAHHPNLQGALARRMIERWGLRLAKWLDQQHELAAIDETLGATLRLLGVARFRSPQLEIVLAALRGESLLLVSATGSGKSLCFQVPVLLRRGCGIVISPLKALMSEQVAGLQRKKIPATFINGDLGPNEKRIRYQLLRDRAIKFLYCTPERFDPGMVRQAEIDEIRTARPNYLVIDEAHCIDRWGRDFRPNYGKLGAARRSLGSPPVLAFTATAGVQSQRRILRSLGIPEARVVVTGVNRPNIALARLDNVPDSKRYELIASLLRLVGNDRAMLFVPTVKTGKALKGGLLSHGVDLPFFHSTHGTANDRDMLLGRFTGRIEPTERVVICTNAFGMGLDVPNVRLVIHWQHPASVEDYLQEFGRAGRDGKPSVAILFTDKKDDGLLKFMAEKTVATAQIDAVSKADALRATFDSISQMHKMAASRGVCFRSAIIQYFEEERSRGRKSLAVMLLEWIFSRATKVPRGRRCCDKCDSVSAKNVFNWAEQSLGGERRLPGRTNANDILRPAAPRQTADGGSRKAGPLSKVAEPGPTSYGDSV